MKCGGAPPVENAEPPNHCGTCMQGCPVGSEWDTAERTCGAAPLREGVQPSVVVMCTLRDTPNQEKVRASRWLQRMHLKQPCQDPTLATDKATGYTQHALGRLPGTHSFWPGGIPGIACTHPNYHRPAQSIQHTVYTETNISRSGERAIPSNS